MIHSKIKQCIQAGIMGAVIVAAMPACTDDHFDVRDGGGVGENATATLWEQIKANPDLSNFAQIAEQTPAFKDEKHPIKNYTFKDVLSSNQILTVFAPTNDAFTAADVHYYDSLVKVRPYDVYLRLVGNPIARNRYVATGQNPDGKPERIIMVDADGKIEEVFGRTCAALAPVLPELENLDIAAFMERQADVERAMADIAQGLGEDN